MFLQLKNKFNKLKSVLGPGLITGAADDDPSGITTYSQTGAQFGLKQLWSAFYLLPLMIAVQEACARIGAVTGKGLAAVISVKYSRKVLVPIVVLVLLANTINIGADLGAMAAAIQILVPVPFTLSVVFFAILIVVLEVFVAYKNYVKFLRFLCLFLLAYVFTLLIIDKSIIELIKATLIPQVELSFSFFFIITGVLGTTISPYMFFWQGSEEVEEEKIHHMLHRDGTVTITKSFINKLRTDNFLGMLSSQFVSWSIIAVSAVVLNKHGITTINSAADAAKALEPLVSGLPMAGTLAKILFSVGLIGLGLLAIPTLSGSAAYAISETFNWREGLNNPLKKAPQFYAVIIISTLLGVILNFLGLNPIRLLIYTAVFNGIAAVPLLYFIAKISSNRDIMGEYQNSRTVSILVWITFIIMAISSLSLLILK